MGTHRVVIVGGGFGGLYAAQSLARAPAEVVVVDRRNFHLFQPLLYQVATGGLDPGDIASPVRHALRRQRNARVLLGDVADIDVRDRRVILRDGTVPYDTLILAAGVRNHYYGNDRWAAVAPGLKTIEDAMIIRRRVLSAFEHAECEPDPERRQAWLTFVVVGAGSTGVELSGALAELAHHTLRKEFRTFDPRTARVLLLEGGDRVLPGFPPELSLRATGSLQRLGVEPRTETFVRDLDEEGIEVEVRGRRERLVARTVVWAAGVTGSPLGRVLADRTGCALDDLGRVRVGTDFSVTGHPEIFVIGDLAHLEHRGRPLPCIAPPAIQAGRFVARLIQARLAGGAVGPFKYLDKGSLATIGRAAAVAEFRGLKFWGLPAWLVWLVIHLLYLIEFENRLLVLIQWANNYVTRSRGSRLITGTCDESPST